MVFAKAKENIQKCTTNKYLPDTLAGGVAGLLSVVITNPIDVVKTKVQGINKNKLTMLGHILDIHKSRGIMGFYSGMYPRMIKTTLEVSLTFSLYYQLQRLALYLMSLKS